MLSSFDVRKITDAGILAGLRSEMQCRKPSANHEQSLPCIFAVKDLQRLQK